MQFPSWPLLSGFARSSPRRLAPVFSFLKVEEQSSVCRRRRSRIDGFRRKGGWAIGSVVVEGDRLLCSSSK
ncbi:hypothetical protein BT93_L2345 [Corymbia citriodora subsp. variegata]|uniref:Uncharacterized protein n=1 Tax=Corymbia citriodora subsp. variegata TaxID=360336 RepID=A0A8T0CK51_CORYI|nr:hypothetical protein BT93_L2345 [Corymbia citriodora subsp. variegata]